MKKIKNNWPAIVPLIFLVLSFGNWPYAFYQTLRWVVCLFTGYLAYTSYRSKRMVWVAIFTITAILFNPIAPFYMERSTWQLIDLTVLVLLIASLFAKKKN